MPCLHGLIIDASNGLPMAAVVHILDAGGRPVAQAGAVRKVGPGLPGFYADGEFMVELSGGLTTVQVERGTEFLPFTWTGQVPWSGITELPIALARWTHLPDRGWFPGNTHVHYDEHEADPDARLRLDPQVHDLHVTVISVLQRGNLTYASNRYHVGLLTDLSGAHRVVDCGEECRHNSAPWTIGYGHVLFLRIQEAVLPISRGLLVDQTEPDYPPLCYACDEARRQGGIAIWCHNGAGMEAPVAAVLGKLAAFNLFDPYQVLPEEYGVWYRMLNCGLHVPASTGSDWYICSHNRVYVQIEGGFSYAAWLAGLAGGRSFITNGPALYLSVNGAGPGDNLLLTPGASVEAEITWESPYPIDNVELIHDGQVIASQSWSAECRSGALRTRATIAADGWLAARLSGSTRDSFWQPVFAHTSPVWLTTGVTGTKAGVAARSFVRALDDAILWVETSGRFHDARQKAEVLDLYRAGQAAYTGIAGRAGKQD